MALTGCVLRVYTHACDSCACLSSGPAGGMGWWAIQQPALFNVNDNWSEDPQLRAEQLAVLRKFWLGLYPEVPWFERGADAHATERMGTDQAHGACVFMEAKCQPGVRVCVHVRSVRGECVPVRACSHACVRGCTAFLGTCDLVGPTECCRMCCVRRIDGWPV